MKFEKFSFSICTCIASLKMEYEKPLYGHRAPLKELVIMILLLEPMGHFVYEKKLFTMSKG